MVSPSPSPSPLPSATLQSPAPLVSAAASNALNYRLPGWVRFDEWLAAMALLLMTLVPLLAMALRPWHQGITNAPLLVQHFGLVLAMFGAVGAERHGHLTSLGTSVGQNGSAHMRVIVNAFAKGSSAIVCGMLALASWRFVASEITANQELAYGAPIWWIQLTMPVGFALLGFKLASRCVSGTWIRLAVSIGLPLAGWFTASTFDGSTVTLWPGIVCLVIMLVTGAPIFAVIGGLALALFWSDALPLASIALSHYSITVNSSLPALPLFTLAGLLFARTGAAARLGALFLALFGGGFRGTVLAAAVLCSAFTAFTGGSGVTILALGGLLLPLLRNSGYPEQRGIGLVTSASALGVLLAPSVPLILYAVIARVPIQAMLVAGLLPALVMVASLLLIGGYLRRDVKLGNSEERLHPGTAVASASAGDRPNLRLALQKAWIAKWEIMAPVVAIGSLVSGLATPTESAALTTAYAILSQAVMHRELTWKSFASCLAECTQVIGGVMLILGMALALTNFLVDGGIPDMAVTWVQAVIPNKYVFLLALCGFLFAAAALMEIFAALVVLVPLLLPVALSYGIDPVHFGIIFLAAMEVGFLCPPAGLNIYFAAAMFDKPIRYVAASVLPAMLAIFVGTMIIALVPALATGLPNFFSMQMK